MQPTIGLTLSLGDDAPRSRVIEYAQKIESLGYDSLWVGESWGRDVFTVLTQIACNTKRIKLVTGIVNVFSRTPSLVGMSIASLDDISGGRAALGIGSSGAKVIQDWHGLPFERPLQRTREYMEIVNLVVSGERVDYQGEFFKLKDFRLRFAPVRKHVPIHLAAMGPKNVELAGEVADGWAPVFFSPKHLKMFRTNIDVGLKKKGRSPESFTLAPWMIGCVSSDIALAKALARGHIAYYVGGMGKYYNELMVRYGFVEEAARIKKLWTVDRDREGAANAVTDAMIDAVAIIGTAAQCREKVREIQAMGVQSPILFVPFGAKWPTVKETVEGLAPSAF